jgi:DNA polymerase-3 subunit beta
LPLPQTSKGGVVTEQLNIEGKRSGDGFVAHREAIIKSLSAAQAARVALLDGDIAIGRKGFLDYLKALGGSNIVKIIPSSGSASGLRATDKTLDGVEGKNKAILTRFDIG